MKTLSEFEKYFEKKEREYEKAQARSDALPDGVVPGKLVRFQVADGYAFYEVTRVSKKTAYLDWRDFSADGYMEPILGSGASLPLKKVAELIRREDFWRKAFNKSGAKE